MSQKESVSNNQILQELANIQKSMRAGFERFDKRFEQVDGRFTQIDKRFEQVDGRFTQIDKRFEQVDGRFTLMNARFDEVIKVQEEHTTMHQETLTKFDNFAKGLEDEKQEREIADHQIEQRVSVLEKALDIEPGV